MKKYIRIELEIDGKVTDWSEYKITSKTTIKSLLKKLQEFLEETAECKVGFKLYEDLLLAVSKDASPKSTEIYLDTLFGVKIYIDPSLKPNEVKLSPHPKKEEDDG